MTHIDRKQGQVHKTYVRVLIALPTLSHNPFTLKASARETDINPRLGFCARVLETRALFSALSWIERLPIAHNSRQLGAARS